MTPEEIEREIERRLQERLQAMQHHPTVEAAAGAAVADGQNARALAARAVSAEQAGFINTGDNVHINNLVAQVQNLPLSDEQLSQEIMAYLQWVRDRTGTIELRGIKRGGQQVVQLDLETVYVPLAARQGSSDKPILLNQILEHGQRLIITGGPGCGKTTVLSHIAWVLSQATGHGDLDLAQAKLGLKEKKLEPKAEKKPFRLPIPILVPLSAYATYLRQLARDAEPERHTLAHFISRYVVEQQGSFHLPTDFFVQLLRRGEQVLLLLDGLDEVPNEGERVKIRQAIENLVDGRNELRIVVTCRTAAYQERTLLGKDFLSIAVQPLQKRELTQLVQQAYRAIYRANPDLAGNKAQELLGAIQQLEANRRHRLGKGADPLITSPLLVRMLLVVHYSERRLPDQRAELYMKATDAMLLPEYGPDEAVSEEIGRLVGGSKELHRELVQYLAYDMHTRGDPQGREIDEQTLAQVLQTHATYSALATDFIALTRLRGTVMEEREQIYRFIHLAFQEFLVARYWAETVRSEGGLAAIIQAFVVEDRVLDSWWREPILLTVGYLAVQAPQSAVSLVEHMLGIAPNAKQHWDQYSATQQWALAELAGTAVLEWPSAPAELRCDIAQRLADLVLAGGETEVPARLRANLGMVLGQLGDPRQGVGVVILEDGLKIPDIAWGKVVPPRKYPIGGDKKAYRGFEAQEVTITESYQLAKYPVTYAQFQCFVDAEDFGDARWWVGMPEHDGSKPTQTLGEQAFPYPNHPRERVSWYQAVAFCRWLSDKLGDEVRLPHEHEWEVAARYNDGRTYTWGNEFDKEKANTRESNLEQTTAVGLYPSGRQPHLDLYDLSGNVWEWCLNKYNDPAQTEVDESGNPRGLRGGSWIDYDDRARAAYRYYGYDHPGDRNGIVGVRLVRVPRPPSFLSPLSSGPSSER